MIEQLDEMQSNIHKCDSQSLKVTLHQMEVERIKYVLSSYLRCRLKKIEKHYGYFLKQYENGEVEKLSPNELKFLKTYKEITDDHVNESLLKHMPKVIRTNFDLASKVKQPNMDAYVFTQTKDQVEGLVVDPETNDQVEDTIDMNVGEQFLIRYRLVEELVEQGKVILI